MRVQPTTRDVHTVTVSDTYKNTARLRVTALQQDRLQEKCSPHVATRFGQHTAHKYTRQTIIVLRYNITIIIYNQIKQSTSSHWPTQD